jgi:uncharacterized alkaline shock family protein YloU
MEETFETDLSISTNVIESIISRSIGGIEGLAYICKGRRGSYEIEVENIDEELSIDAHIAVNYGVKIPALAADVRAAIAEAIETQVGLPIAAVNIFVDEIVFAEK